MKNITFALLMSITFIGCSLEEHPSQSVIENTLPKGGPTIAYAPENSFTNIDEITATLSKNHAEKFNNSLGWYGTQSNFGLAKLEGKTARQAVDIVNCLKGFENEEQQLTCFE